MSELPAAPIALEALGWSPFFAAHFEPFARDGLIAARVAVEHRNVLELLSERGELLGEVAGRLRHEAQSAAELPAVGDWVAVEPRPGSTRATVRAVLPRRTHFSRKVADRAMDEQVVAANVDTVLVVMALDPDFSSRRLERYLTLVLESGASPAIVLSKADLCSEREERRVAVEALAGGAPVHVVSAPSGEGLDALRRHFEGHRTVALLGSSGVGKSTIVNRILGDERQATTPVREWDGTGRHTTTRRELCVVPGGGLIIDTPGMRELQLWVTGEDALGGVFEDLSELGRGCRFKDCAHDREPGCAVREAVATGVLDAARLEGFRKLERELRFVAAKQAVRERAERKKTRRARGDDDDGW